MEYSEIKKGANVLAVLGKNYNNSVVKATVTQLVEEMPDGRKGPFLVINGYEVVQDNCGFVGTVCKTFYTSDGKSYGYNLLITPKQVIKNIE